jgi:AraC-like DNA-binding protein/mannose-6-phosphate isomerase-like protein (cupin superfamily)
MWVREMDDLPKVSRSVYQFDNRFFSEKKIYGQIHLIQIGDIQCQEDSVVPEHVQPCFEITYIVSGKGVCVVNGERLPVVKKDIVVNIKDDTHSIISDNDNPLRYFFLSVELLVSHPLFNQFRVFQKMITSTSSRVQSDRFMLQELFNRCIGEFSNFNEFSDTIIGCCLNQIICYIFQNFNLKRYQYRPEYGKQEVLVYKIINFITGNIMDINSVNDVFEHFHYSASHISHLFATHMHQTLASYIRDCKMEQSITLMKDSRHSITEIAEILGYSSIHSFSRAFKAHYNVSPRKWYAESRSTITALT